MNSSVDAAETLARGLAARLVHDLAGPAAGVLSGLDLFADPKAAELHDEALDLTRASARALRDWLAFFRLIFADRPETQTPAALHTLALVPFEGRRATLRFTDDVSPVGAVAGQTLLLLLLVAVGGLASGGEAVVSTDVAGGTRVRVEGRGPRAGLANETLRGLRGEDFETGLRGRWAPARYAHTLCATRGGELTLTLLDDGFALQAIVPED